MCLRSTSATRKVSEPRHDVLAQHQPVVGYGCRLAVHRHVFALIAFREVAHGRLGRQLHWLRRHRRLACLDARDDPFRVLAGMVDEVFRTVPTQRHALRAPEGICLDDEHLGARGIDADAEPREVAVPEHRVLAIDREAVHHALVEGAVLTLCHA